MKTTVELSDELFRKAKAEAALQTPRAGRPRPSLEELMAPARGVVDSGVADLASNPKHMKGFGRAARRNR